jgi:hypothetical protein
MSVVFVVDPEQFIFIFPVETWKLIVNGNFGWKETDGVVYAKECYENVIAMCKKINRDCTFIDLTKLAPHSLFHVHEFITAFAKTCPKNNTNRSTILKTVLSHANSKDVDKPFDLNAQSDYCEWACDDEGDIQFSEIEVWLLKCAPKNYIEVELTRSNSSNMLDDQEDEEENGEDDD